MPDYALRVKRPLGSATRGRQRRRVRKDQRSFSSKKAIVRFHAKAAASGS